MNIDNLYVEKYRPKILEEIILSPENTRIIEEYEKKGEIPNLCIVGTPGIGKTTLSKVIVNDMLQCQYMYINASDENGIDTIRNKVITFSKTKSLDGKLKVIILDEADALSVDAQRALRNTMEEYSGYTRFILTGNYKYKIIPALISRCQLIDLTPPFEAVVKRCFKILKVEGIEVSDKTQFIQFIRTLYPDIRRCLNELQKNIIGGELILNNADAYSVLPELYKHITAKNHDAVRTIIISNENKFGGDYVGLLRELFKYIDKNEKVENKKQVFLLTIMEFIYKAAFVVDQEINCYACMITLIRSAD